MLDPLQELFGNVFEQRPDVWVKARSEASLLLVGNARMPPDVELEDVGVRVLRLDPLPQPGQACLMRLGKSLAAPVFDFVRYHPEQLRLSQVSQPGNKLHGPR